jgi:hypothetical protein
MSAVGGDAAEIGLALCFDMAGSSPRRRTDRRHDRKPRKCRGESREEGISRYTLSNLAPTPISASRPRGDSNARRAREVQSCIEPGKGRRLLWGKSRRSGSCRTRSADVSCRTFKASSSRRSTAYCARLFAAANDERIKRGKIWTADRPPDQASPQSCPASQSRSRAVRMRAFDARSRGIARIPLHERAFKCILFWTTRARMSVGTHEYY